MAGFSLWDPNQPLWGIANLIATEEARKSIQPNWDLAAREFAANQGGGPGISIGVSPGGPTVGAGGRYASPSFQPPYTGTAPGEPGWTQDWRAKAPPPGVAIGPRGQPLPSLTLGGGPMDPRTQKGVKKPGEGGGFLGGVGEFITTNPELITGVLGTAADVYGAAKERKQREKEFEEMMEHRRKQLEAEQIGMILRGITAFA